MQRFLPLLLSALSGIASASPLIPLGVGDLAHAIAFGRVLFEERGVRVVMVYRQVSECWGPITTCPDADLYISYHNGALGEQPKVYRLPPAKAWKVVGWRPSGILRIETALPEANVDPKERAIWHSVVYEIELREICAQEC